MITGSTKRLRVAVVDEEFPYPANSGKRIRTLNLISRLAASHDITYIAHRNADPHELEQAKRYFESLGIETIEIPRQIQFKSGVAFYAKLAVNLLSDLPYSVESHVSDEMKTKLSELNASGTIDVWHCEWTPYAEMFRKVDAKPLIIAAHNVESLIWRRYTETESNPVKRWYIRKQWKKFESFERWAFTRADRTIAVSSEDARLAKDEFGANNVEVVENGVDVTRYVHDGTKRNPKEMIFLGSLDWRPNLDGIERFLDTAFPKIVAAEPGARLKIVGRNPPEWLQERSQSHPKVELCANVPEVLPHLSEAGLMVVPLRIGGGSRLKIIEAAANGLPVISTRIGAEGLSFQPNHEYFVAESIEEMDGPVLSLLKHAEQGVIASQRARAMAEMSYDWESLAQIQASVWQSVAAAN